jgi:hypothetical protein
MSYQDRIYRQGGICAQRNGTIGVVSTSSDLFLYDIPFFTITNSGKINQKELTFDLSGVSYNDIFTGTTNCFTTNNLSGTCFNSIDWYTNIYENNMIVYSNNFFSSTGLTGDIPNIMDFSGSVITAFNALGYTYNNTGTTYTILQPSSELKLTLSSVLNVIEDCPLTGSSSGNTFSGTCETSEEVFNLDFSGLTTADTYVYAISTQTGITLDFIFTANTTSFNNDTQTKFKFEVYKYDKNNKGFNSTAVYKSPSVNWLTLSATSATTLSVPINNLFIDGDYLIKGYYEYNMATEMALLLGKQLDTSTIKYGDSYSIYDSRNDYYMVAIKTPSVPKIKLGQANNLAINAFSVNSFELTGGQTEVILPASNGDFIISVNGLTLSLDYDYSITGVTNGATTIDILKLMEPAVEGDLMTIAFSNNDTGSTLRVDTYDIQTIIPTGPSNNQGTNKVYYNTTTNKYEVYTTMELSSNNDAAITLNGMTLANNIDYYQSSSSNYRLILEGNIVTGDIINIYYNSVTEVQGNISDPNPVIAWDIDPAPIDLSGNFTIELASDESFTNIINSATTEYIIGVTGYATQIKLIGGFGTELYYRIKNEKRYKAIANDNIVLTEYSDIVPITVNTNATNNY